MNDNNIKVLAEYVQFLRYVQRRIVQLEARGLDRTRASAIRLTAREDVDTVVGVVCRKRGSAVDDALYSAALVDSGDHGDEIGGKAGE